jgi:hypothetical protein
VIPSFLFFFARTMKLQHNSTNTVSTRSSEYIYWLQWELNSVAFFAVKNLPSVRLVSIFRTMRRKTRICYTSMHVIHEDHPPLSWAWYELWTVWIRDPALNTKCYVENAVHVPVVFRRLYWGTLYMVHGTWYLYLVQVLVFGCTRATIRARFISLFKIWRVPEFFNSNTTSSSTTSSRTYTRHAFFFLIIVLARVAYSISIEHRTSTSTVPKST